MQSEDIFLGLKIVANFCLTIARGKKSPLIFPTIVIQSRQCTISSILPSLVRFKLEDLGAIHGRENKIAKIEYCVFTV